MIEMTNAEFTAQDIINAQTNAKIDILAQEMKDFKDEMKDFKNEMRDRDNRRAAENEELRQSIKEIYQATDAKIGKIESKIDSMGNHIRNLAITAMVGIIAAGAGIAAMVISALTKS